jgi:uncharacterized membrane-anchored protein
MAIDDKASSLSPFGWTEHPHRRLIHAETHARPVPAVQAPAVIRRVAFMSADRGRDLTGLQRRIADLANAAPEHAAAARQIEFERDGRSVVWEMHNEFTTLTWKSAPEDPVVWPEGIGLEWHKGLAFVSATRIEVLDEEAIPAGRLAQLAPSSLCHSAIYGGQAEVATDFTPDAEAFVNFTVAAARCGDQRRGVIARRLFEIETYRCFTLLGLPVARGLGGLVQEFEQRLSRIMGEIGEQAAGSHREAFDALHQLSVEAGRAVEETSFRFAATQAYGQILNDRLPRLGESAIGESTTLARFLDNRMQPALSTCRAMEKRLTELTQKVQRSIELLDTRITVSIQTQNQEVLDTILSTAQSQFRLQQTVEGLSIIAISYYLLGLIGYILEGVHSRVDIDKPLALAIIAPFVLAIVYFGISRLRRVHGLPK